MKTYIKTTLALCAPLALLASCSENSWNDHLEGFETPTIGNVKDITYRLTATDYSKITSSSTNKALAASLNESEALTAIGKNGCFADAEQAHRYIPAFLSSTDFAYFSLDNKSAVNIEFALAGELPQSVRDINANTSLYTVSEADYQAAWGSDDDFINGFAPMKPASASLPGLLRAAYPGAAAGDVVVADYKWSDVNPVFGTTADPGPQTWETDVLKDLELNQEVTVRGVVTGLCTRGFILTDLAGSILCYQASGFDMSSVPLYSKVEISGPVSAYGTALQIAVSDNYTIAGTAEYTYPTSERYTYDDVETACGRSGNYLAQFVSFEATCAISGNYTNFIFADGTAFDASAYMFPSEQQARLTDGEEYWVEGWMVSVSGGKHMNVVVTDIIPSAAMAPAKKTVRRAPASEIATTAQSAIYRYDGTAWTVPADVYLVQPADYTLMGLNYGNFSSSALPASYLPKLLSMRFPFAAEGDTKTVAYKWYASSVTSYEAQAYTLTQGEWVRDNGTQAVSEQFVKSNNVWNYDPSINVTITTDKTPDNQAFYQACVDWVFETKCKPLGSTDIKSGMFWVTSYGNNEYWSGTSAYQCNVDIRPSAARNQYAAGFEGMSDQEVSDFIMRNLLEGTFPAVLPKYWPDLGPVDGIDVTLTITFGIYTGARSNVTAVYNVTAPGVFEYASSTYFDGE